MKEQERTLMLSKLPRPAITKPEEWNVWMKGSPDMPSLRSQIRASGGQLAIAAIFFIGIIPILAYLNGWLFFVLGAVFGIAVANFYFKAMTRMINYSFEQRRQYWEEFHNARNQDE